MPSWAGSCCKLSEILRAAYIHSPAGNEAGSLAQSVGGPHRDQFDFDALSRVVGRGVVQAELPAARRARLTHTLGVLEAQRFHAPVDALAPPSGDAVSISNSTTARPPRGPIASACPSWPRWSRRWRVAELEIRGPLCGRRTRPLLRGLRHAIR
jgi:hypothetical protein